MKKKLLIIICFVISILFADEIRLNFFFDVKVDSAYTTSPDSLLFLQNQIVELTADSTADISKNIFMGDVLAAKTSDSLLVSSLEKLLCDVAIPTDFRFEYLPANLSYTFLGSNLKRNPKSPALINSMQLNTDSLSVALLAVYTPDWMVKNRINSVHYDYEFKKNITTLTDSLGKENDVVVLFSNFSKFVNERLSADWNIDYIISFDYAKSSPTKFGDIHFYNIKYKSRWMSSLKLIYENGKITHKWIPQKYDFHYPKPDKQISKESENR